MAKASSTAGDVLVYKNHNIVDAADLVPSEVNLCEVNSESLFKKQQDLKQIDGLHAAVFREPLVIRERPFISVGAQKLQHKLSYLWPAMHGSIILNRNIEQMEEKTEAGAEPNGAALLIENLKQAKEGKDRS